MFKIKKYQFFNRLKLYLNLYRNNFFLNLKKIFFRNFSRKHLFLISPF